MASTLRCCSRVSLLLRQGVVQPAWQRIAATRRLQHSASPASRASCVHWPQHLPILPPAVCASPAVPSPASPASSTCTLTHHSHRLSNRHRTVPSGYSLGLRAMATTENLRPSPARVNVSRAASSDAATSANKPRSADAHHSIESDQSSPGSGSADGKLNASASTPTTTTTASSTTTTEAADDAREEETDRVTMQNMSIPEKLRYVFSKYGKVAIGFYIVVGTLDTLLFYTAIQLGFDVKPFIDATFQFFGFQRTDFLSPSMGAFFAAYTLHKLCLPPRVILTASVTPSLARALRRRYPHYFTPVVPGSGTSSDK